MAHFFSFLLALAATIAFGQNSEDCENCAEITCNDYDLKGTVFKARSPATKTCSSNKYSSYKAKCFTVKYKAGGVELGYGTCSPASCESTKSFLEGALTDALSDWECSTCDTDNCNGPHEMGGPYAPPALTSSSTPSPSLPAPTATPSSAGTPAPSGTTAAPAPTSPPAPTFPTPFPTFATISVPTPSTVAILSPAPTPASSSANAAAADARRSGHISTAAPTAAADVQVQATPTDVQVDVAVDDPAVDGIMSAAVSSSKLTATAFLAVAAILGC